MKKFLGILATITIIPFFTGVFSEAGKQVVNTPKTEIKNEVKKETTDTEVNQNDNKTEVGNKPTYAEDEYTPGIKLIEQNLFDSENEYTIYAGKFNTEDGVNKRLKEVQSKYDYATSAGDRVVLESDSGISAEDIYSKSLEYHDGLLGVISDTLKFNEKWAAPTIKNKYIQK